ncbi:hypothetical protein CHELA1G11_21901 [Hyphomicrobiales bacterium]|nr:hypothetical protein CHELA1G2_20165 [Hyphomicrobiales bacterium]CAH1695528.1 hypothetical protein CHELA1G11_21901 [Hyphomicrobiales bacterium]
MAATESSPESFCTNLRAGLAMSVNGRIVRSSLAAVFTPLDSMASMVCAHTGFCERLLSAYFFVTERWPK